MEIKLKPGKYILAISGGVDSMVLLDLVIKKYVLKPNYPSGKYSFIVVHLTFALTLFLTILTDSTASIPTH